MWTHDTFARLLELCVCVCVCVCVCHAQIHAHIHKYTLFQRNRGAQGKCIKQCRELTNLGADHR